MNLKSKQRRDNKKRKFEFSKWLVVWALIVTTISLTVSYLLSAFGHDPCSEITVSITGACIAIAVAYQAKSYGEKNSMNKYGLSALTFTIQNNNDDDDENDKSDEEALG